MPRDGLRVLFLDIDDTLYDYEASIETHVEEVRRGFPELAPFAAAEFLELYWHGYARIPTPDKAALLRRDVDAYRRRVWQEVLAPLGRAAPDLDAVAARFSDLRDARLAPNAGAHDLLRRAAGEMRIGVISNGPGDLQRRKLRALGVEAWLDPALVFISHEVGCDKPDARIFRRALEGAGVDGGACLMVGDDAVCDVGSKGVGMRFALFAGRDGPAPRCEPAPDAVVRSFEELDRWLFPGASR